jgi:hypothetical protein
LVSPSSIIEAILMAFEIDRHTTFGASTCRPTSRQKPAKVDIANPTRRKLSPHRRDSSTSSDHRLESAALIQCFKAGENEIQADSPSHCDIGLCCGACSFSCGRQR